MKREIQCIFFKETRPFYWSTLTKKNLPPPEKSKLVKIAKICEKWLSMGVPPIFHPIYFSKNDSELLEEIRHSHLGDFLSSRQRRKHK